MSDPILPLAVWQEGTLQNDVPANDNSLRVEALTRPCLGVANSPPTPNDGDVYVVGSAPTGAFSTFAPDDIAIYRGGNWYAWAPVEGLPLIINDVRMIWAGSSGWVADPSIGGGAVDSVNGQTGVVVLDAGDVGAATAAQGTTADSAVQPGDAVTVLTMSTARLLGRSTASTGAVEEITLGTNLSFTGTTLNAAGGGGGGSPGGSDTSVQYNDGGSFGGDATFTFNDTSKALGVNILNTAKGSDIARASTTDIWAATGNFVHLTGTTTITSFGSNTAGQWRIVRFAGAGTLTHNGTSLILPGAANITTAANDTAIVVGEGSSNARVVVYNRASGLPIVNPTVSITGWTPSLATASPNGTVNVSRMLASGGTTNQDACIQPKGNGAFLVNLPDGTSTGGDKRGVYAFDGQGVRGNANEVAQGDYSVLLGANSRAGATGAVALGYGNVVNDQYGIAPGGTGNTAGYCAFATGLSTVAQGQYAFSSGQGTAADGENSWAGGFGATARGIYGCFAWASGNFFAQGDGQDRRFFLRAATTNATQTTVTTNSSSASTNNQIILPDNSAFVVKGTINVRENTTGDSSAWDFTAYIKRGSGAATTAMVVACTPTLIGQDAGAATWTVAVDADTTNGGLRCRVTGQASHNLRWGWSIYSCNEVVG